MSDGAQASASAAPALASASASAPTSQAAPAPEGAPAPPYKRIQYAVLGRDGLEFKQGPNKRRDDLVDKDDADARFASAQQITPVRNFEYSSDDGSKVVVHQTTGFSVLDTDSGALVCRVERAGLLKVGVSPRGSFVLTWEKHQSGNKEGNMIVWRVADGAVVFRAFEKNLLDTTWPLVKWSSDEKVAAHLITNNVCMYDGASFDKYHKVRVLCSLSRSPSLSLFLVFAVCCSLLFRFPFPYPVGSMRKPPTHPISSLLMRLASVITDDVTFTLLRDQRTGTASANQSKANQSEANDSDCT